MSRFIKKRISEKSSLPPGTLVHIGDNDSADILLSSIQYNSDEFYEHSSSALEELKEIEKEKNISWLNINGVHDTDLIEKIGRKFDIHSLTLEDIVNTGQRPKFEENENYIYIVLKMLYLEKEDKIYSEQVSLILKPGLIISFQEKPGDVFETIRERLRNNKGKIRKMSADYLLYALIDAIIDNYFVILEKYGDKIEELEEEVFKQTTLNMMPAIHDVKREMLYLRKCVWPLREVINNFIRTDSPLIKADLNIYLKDLYDHTIQIMDSIESFRDILSGIKDMFLSSVSNKTNDIMKVLTIFAAIFIPLTFIAGIYGMNFEVMPELKYKYGYYIVLMVMLLTVLSLLAFFKKKRWL